MDKSTSMGAVYKAPSTSRPIPDRVIRISILSAEIDGEISILEGTLEPFMSSIAEEPSRTETNPNPEPACKFEVELEEIQVSLLNTLRKLTSIRIRLQL